MDHSSIGDKLKRVLYKFSDCNYQCFGSDDVYLANLISILTSNDTARKENGHVLARLPLCMEWLAHVADAWKDALPHQSVAAFALQLARAAVGDSQIFICLQSAGILDRFLSSLKVEIDKGGFVATAYVSLLSELLEHDYGCCWILETGVWWRVIKLSVDSRRMQMCREGHNFISKLIARLQSKNDSCMCKIILNHVLEVLRLAKVNSQGDALKEDDRSLVVASLPFLCSILEAAMSSTGVTFALIQLEDRELESLMWHFIKVTDDEAFVGKFLKILVLQHLLMFKNKNDKPLIIHNSFKTKFFEIISYLILKVYVKSVLYVCFECQVYFHKFSINSVKFEDKSKPYELKDQLLVFQMIPILCYDRDYNTTSDFFILNYIQKFFDSSCEDTIRLAYLLKNYILLGGSKIPESEYPKCAIIYILQLENCLNKEQLATLCQALIYVLKTVVTGNLNEYLVQHSNIMSMILDGLSNLLERFQISWREGVDCTGLFSYLDLLLKNSSLSSIMAVKALRLMQVTVRNYLPPNLALLVNTMGGSSIQELGPLVHRRLHDTSWDVRDSALELLHTVTDISHVNFPAFQEHIMKNGLCTLTLALAMDDCESYVRASALKCLAAMLKVPRYWDDCFRSQDLPSKMISILTDESEGIVRKEAALLMKEMYQHQTIPKSVEAKVFMAMVSAATHDLYWEVKVNALCFWEKVIEQQMSHQGMIDGRFPSVTFSKDNRKIVTLTQNEVKLRINKVLGELGYLGCLQVLLSAIHDCDLQVVYKAVAITTSLLSLLSQYDILPTGAAVSHEVSMFTQHVDDEMQQGKEVLSASSKVSTSVQVIDNIVNELDIILLSQVHHNQRKVAKASLDVTVVPMKAEDFVSALSALNLQDLVSQRTQWIDNCSESLNSLLDDILFTQENGHVLARLPLCMEWLAHVADAWKDALPHQSVAAFALQLARAAVGDSQIFICLQSAGILDRFLSSLKVEIDKGGFVATAYVSLLSELLEHDYGCCWILETGVWWRVIKLSVDSRRMQMCREGHNFISKLIARLQSKNDSCRCKIVLNHVLEVLRLAKVNSQGDALKEDDRRLVVASLPFLCSILEAAMSSTGVTFALIQLEDRELESLMWHFIKVTDDEAFVGKFLKILVLQHLLMFKNKNDKPLIIHNSFKTKFF